MYTYNKNVYIIPINTTTHGVVFDIMYTHTPRPHVRHRSVITAAAKRATAAQNTMRFISVC